MISVFLSIRKGKILDFDVPISTTVLISAFTINQSKHLVVLDFPSLHTSIARASKVDRRKEPRQLDKATVARPRQTQIRKTHLGLRYDLLTVSIDIIFALWYVTACRTGNTFHTVLCNAPLPTIRTSPYRAGFISHAEFLQHVDRAISYCIA